MKYLTLPAKVSIAFYTRPDWSDKRYTKKRLKNLRRAGFWINIFTKTNLHHCGIMLNRGENTVVLAADKYHRVKFLDQEPYHQKVMKPLCVVEVGEADVSLVQLADFLKEPYKGDARSLIFWYLFGKRFLPLLTPKTCSVISCYFLRMCGFHYSNCISPRDLYEELLSKGCSVKTWEEFATENKLRI
jgi:hypothetical protein